MYVRLGFSVAINVDPEILLVDEVLAVGDANFQDKCMEKFAEFRRAGKTVILVSHATGTMRSLCDEVAWLDHGKLIGLGDPADIIDSYVEESHDERVDLGDGRFRWGTGEARVTSVEMIDTAGKDIRKAHTGDEVTLRLHYHADELIEKPVFILALYTLDGVFAWAQNSRDGKWVPDSISGDGSVDLHIPRLALQAGTFELTAGIADHTVTHTYDSLTASIRFDILPSTPHESGGVASLGGTWSNLMTGNVD
jgi:ABC-2 type transport system ATP-binding protein